MRSLLTRLRAVGLTLAPTDDGRLAVTGAVPAALRTVICENRDALVEHLRGETRARELLDRFDTLDERDLDQLVVLAVGYFDDEDLERLNVALARRHGLDADAVRETAAAFDRPKDPPIRM